MNVVPVDPDTNLVRAMQAGAFGLRHGKILVLFPEGERSPDGTPRTFKKGAAILSDATRRSDRAGRHPRRVRRLAARRRLSLARIAPVGRHSHQRCGLALPLARCCH